MGLDHRLQGGCSGEHSRSGRLFGPPWIHEKKRGKKNNLAELFCYEMNKLNTGVLSENPECGANHSSDPNNQWKTTGGKYKPVGDLVYFSRGGTNEKHRERDRGSSGAEVTGEPWESRETNGKQGPWSQFAGGDRGTVEKLILTSVEPWEEDRGAGKAWELGWS